MKRIILLVILLVMIEIAFYFLMGDLEAVSGHNILDMGLQNNEETYQILSDYGVEGRSIYNKIQLVDFIFPLCYGLLFILIMKYQGCKLTIIPLLAATFDYIENINIYRMLRAYPDNLMLGSFNGIFTVLKFTLLGISLILMVVYGLRRWRK